MKFYVYIIYNINYDKYYVGQTNDLERRIFEHNNKLSSYTSKYGGGWVLVYEEVFNYRADAMKREKFLKKQKSKSFYKNISNVLMEKETKHIKVVVGCIIDNNKVLVCDRFEKDLKNACKISFPGGKIEVGESEEEALMREIKEETDLNVSLEQKIPFNHFNIWEYPNLVQHTDVVCFVCRLNQKENLVLTETDKDKNWRWIDLENINTDDVLPGIDKFLSWVKNYLV